MIAIDNRDFYCNMLKLRMLRTMLLDQYLNAIMKHCAAYNVNILSA